MSDQSEPTPPSGFPDLGGLLAQAQQMQQQLMEAQAAAASAVVEGRSGGGAVRVQVTGGLEFRAVHIDPAVIDPEDPTMLEDLVLAALHDATAQVQEMQQGAMGDLGGLADMFGGPEMDETMGGLGGGLGGLGGGLGGMLGQGDDRDS